MDEEKGQLQLRIQELEKQVADLKAENARLKGSLSERDLKDIKWCGTPMVDEGKIKPPKQEKMGDTPKIVEKNLVAWCGTPQMDEDHPLSQAEGLKAGSAPSEGDGPRDAEGSRAKAGPPKKPKP